MITRCKADAQRACTAAAAAPAASSSSSSTGAAAAACSQPLANAAAAMTDDDGRSHNADPVASAAATATDPLAGAAAASAISGHKRAADSRDSVAADPPTAAAAPSLSSESQLQADASEQSQIKKQRGEPSSQVGSAAAAASSVGFEPLSSVPTAAASSSVSPVGMLSDGPINAAQSARSVVADDDAKESQPAASSASASSSSESPPAPLDSGQQELQRILDEAQRLIRGALPFADGEVHRLLPGRVAEVRLKMRELADAKARLELVLASPTVEQADQLVICDCSIESLTAWLNSAEGGGLAFVAFRIIDDARAAVQDPAALNAPARLCDLCWVFMALATALPATQLTVLSTWFLRVDQLFTRLCDVIPRVQLTRLGAKLLLQCAVDGGVLQLIPVLMRSPIGCEFPLRCVGEDPLLTHLCLHVVEHYVCLEPYLRMFEYGLDPTLITVGGNRVSALQLARNFVRDHPLPAVPAVDRMAEMRAAVTSESDSVLAGYASVHPERHEAAETGRREALHARFLHALISAWVTHWTKVRALLSEAAPDRLIPPLVDIVSRYLDLEGVPPERSAPAEEKAEMEN